MRSTLTGIQSKQVLYGEQVEGSVNHAEWMFASPSAVMGGLGPNPNTCVLGEGSKGVGSRGWTGGNTFGVGTCYGPGAGQSNWRYRKLDMPVFDGSDSDGWIMRVERYFGFYRLSEDEMLEAVVVAMEGDALRWFQWENKRHPIRRWVDLKGFILRQFRSVSGGSLYEQWLSKVQTSTVQEYRRKFIETAAPLERVSEDMLMGHFMNGSKEEIKTEVRLMNPMCLEQAMEQAVRIEDKHRVTAQRRTNLSVTKYGNYLNYSKSTPTVAPYSLTHPTSPTLPKNWSSRESESQASVQSPTHQSGSDVKRLTGSELQEKRLKGLCYRCDAKWSVGASLQKQRTECNAYN